MSRSSVLLISFFLLTILPRAQTPSQSAARPAGLDVAAIDRAIGKSGQAMGDVYRVSFPRSDLSVTVGDVKIKPGFALGSWAAFKSKGPGNADAVVHGDRIDEGSQSRRHLSCEDIGGEFLVVSQFTLCADLTKGKRPGFEQAMRPPGSEQLYLKFVERLAALTGRPVKTGKFGASMVVALKNGGPATYWLEMP